MGQWVSVESDFAPIMKWAKLPVGEGYEGIYHGMHKGLHGLLADIETSDGRIALPVNSVLKRQLDRVRVGALVKIIHKGLTPSAKPGALDYRDFDVQVANKATDLLPAPLRRASGDDVSF
jgi:hypothetical protein